MYTNLQFEKVKGRAFIATITAIMLVVSVFLPNYAHAKEPLLSNAKIQMKKNILNVVVLGDSLAAGYENGFTVDSVPYGFGEHIYEQAMFQGYRANYSNYGILGLRSESLLKWLNAADKQAPITANELQAGLKDPNASALIGSIGQFRSDLQQADLIVLAIGGNDFLQILAGLDLTKSVSSMTATEKDNLVQTLSSSTEQYTNNLKSILEMVQALNSDVIIATQNQYIPLPKLVLNGVTGYLGGIATDLAELLIDAQSTLNTQFDEVITSAAKQGLAIDYIDAASVIDPNALGLTAIAAGDPHPSRAGYAKLGEAYAQLLWGEYKKPGARKEGEPVSVVVNGTQVSSPYPTKVINGRTYLVLRDITNAVGADLKWDNTTKSAIVTLNDRAVKFTVGANSYSVNGQSYSLDAPVFNATIGKENKTYLPVAALSAGLDLFVQYRSELKTVFVAN